MVTRPVGNSRGTVRLGALFTLLVLTLAAYYGVDPIGHYLDYAAMRDEMKDAARLGPSLEDGAIRRRLVQKAEELGLPEEAKNFRIVRSRSPREIRISTSWEVTLDFSPFFVRQHRFEYQAKGSLLRNPLGVGWIGHGLSRRG